MKRSKFIFGIFLGFQVLAMQSLIAQKRPNIIIILADDLGYGDVGYHGGKEIPTPNIDALAETGTYFTAGYAMAPVCGPSRAGMLTGRYQNRFGFEDNPGGNFRKTEETKPGIPLDEVTLGEHLQKEGYRTAWIGKDHQGRFDIYHPTKRGFDEFFGFLNGASEYFIGDNPKKMLQRGTIPVKEEEEYLTDAFAREAVSFIKKNQDNPFFLYLPFNAVHGPLQAKKEDLELFKSIKNEKRRTLAAMHHSMDENIGKITSTLKELNLDKNTLLVFYSDNGGKIHGNYSYNTPLKGEKGMVLDGGIRVPFLMKWEGEIKGNQELNFPVAAIDIYKTVLAAVDAKNKPVNELDGINLLPYMNGDKIREENRYLYWRFLYQWAIRDNEWKLLKLKGKDKSMELYHISEDISEKNNVIDQYPEIAKKLKKEFDKWASTMKEPQWSWQPAFGGSITTDNEDK